MGIHALIFFETRFGLSTPAEEIWQRLTRCEWKVVTLLLLTLAIRWVFSHHRMTILQFLSTCPALHKHVLEFFAWSKRLFFLLWHLKHKSFLVKFEFRFFLRLLFLFILYSSLLLRFLYFSLLQRSFLLLWILLWSSYSFLIILSFLLLRILLRSLSFSLLLRIFLVSITFFTRWNSIVFRQNLASLLVVSALHAVSVHVFFDGDAKIRRLSLFFLWMGSYRLFPDLFLHDWLARPIVLFPRSLILMIYLLHFLTMRILWLFQHYPATFSIILLHQTLLHEVLLWLAGRCLILLGTLILLPIKGLLTLLVFALRLQTS